MTDERRDLAVKFREGARDLLKELKIETLMSDDPRVGPMTNEDGRLFFGCMLKLQDMAKELSKNDHIACNDLCMLLMCANAVLSYEGPEAFSDLVESVMLKTMEYRMTPGQFKLAMDQINSENPLGGLKDREVKA